MQEGKRARWQLLRVVGVVGGWQGAGVQDGAARGQNKGQGQLQVRWGQQGPDVGWGTLSKMVGVSTRGGIPDRGWDTRQGWVPVRDGSG